MFFVISRRGTRARVRRSFRPAAFDRCIAKRSLVRAVGVRSHGFDPPDSQRRDVFSRVRRQVYHKSHRPINSVTTLVVRLPDEPSERICPLPCHHPQLARRVVRRVYPVHEPAVVYLFIRSDPERPNNVSVDVFVK